MPFYVRKYPGPCDPRDLCFAAQYHLDGYTAPWRWATMGGGPAPGEPSTTLWTYEGPQSPDGPFALPNFVLEAQPGWNARTATWQSPVVEIEFPVPPKRNVQLTLAKVANAAPPEWIDGYELTLDWDGQPWLKLTESMSYGGLVSVVGPRELVGPSGFGPYFRSDFGDPPTESIEAVWLFPCAHDRLFAGPPAPQRP